MVVAIPDSNSNKKKRNLDGDDNTCPECHGHVVTDDVMGERHCELCGLVIDSNMISHRAEYRIYSDEQRNRERVGPPKSETLHDKGISTRIDTSMRDSHGRPLSSDGRRKAHRLLKWQYKSLMTNSQQRNLRHALDKITTKASQMGLSNDVRDETAHLYRRAVYENIIRGRSINSVVAASFYLACRICGQPRTVDEIAKNMGVSRKECGRIYRFMKRLFKLRLEPPTAQDFLERYCQGVMCRECGGHGVKPPKCDECDGRGSIDIHKDGNILEGVCKKCKGKCNIGDDCDVCGMTGKVDLPDTVVNRAKELMRMCEDSGLESGKAPMGLVAAVIYTAVEEAERKDVTQKEVADKCDVTEVTLRNRYKDIQTLLES